MSEPDAAEIIVDARGHRCPLPTLRLRRALEASADGTRIVLMADDPLARIDVPHYCAAAGLRLIATETGERWLRFVVEKPARG